MAQYPILSIECVEGYASAVIHLSKNKSTFAFVSMESLELKLSELLDAREISYYNYFEFLKEAFEAGLIQGTILGAESDYSELSSEKFSNYLEKINPYSKKACIIKTRTRTGINWKLSGPNFCSDPFWYKETGYLELEQLKLLGSAATPEEISDLYKLLTASKEIPLKILEDIYVN